MPADHFGQLAPIRILAVKFVPQADKQMLVEIVVSENEDQWS